MVLLVFTDWSIQLVEFDNGLEAIVLNLEDNVGVVLLGPSQDQKGSTAKRTQRIASLKWRANGRTCSKHSWFSNGGRTNWWRLIQMPLERKAPGVIFRQPVLSHYKQDKAVDAMIPQLVVDNVSCY
jgi:F-type H+-transporting ATPase subunit alpha